MMRNSTTPAIEMVVYWRFRYACAPCWMAAAISCMRALPAGSDTIHFAEIAPYPMAIAAQTSAKTICSIADSLFFADRFAGWEAREKPRILAENHDSPRC